MAKVKPVLIEDKKEDELISKIGRDQEIIDLLNSILVSLKSIERNTFKGY